MTEVAVRSPQWWLDQLFKRLTTRNVGTRALEEYYDGRPKLKFVTKKYEEGFGAMLRGVSDNWMALVVDAAEERLHIDGFRVGDESAGDKPAWEIWQRNSLDADSELLHRDALVTGRGYAMVWYGTDGAEITVEEPTDVIVAYQAGSRRTREAALKAWTDEWTGRVYANVYLPDAIWKFEAPAPGEGVGVESVRWTPRAGDEMVANPLKVVPIVEFRNRPRTNGSARSEIEDVLSVQDQINKLVCDMLVASEFAAYPQRYAAGIEPDVDPDTGEEKPPFKAAIDRVWTTGDPETKFGQFAAADLGNYVKAIENRVQSLASRTRTPPHYLLGQSGSFPSGESLKATETGLVAKVRSKARHFGESWEEVMRLAGDVEEKDGLSAAIGAEVIWRDPESRTEAEHIDALGKLRVMLNVPLEQLWADAGYTPQQIGRFRSMLLDEALLRIAATPTEPAVPGPEPDGTP